ncbi:FKBP-type peptidyl-prolyl cis-trans isomerase [Pseudonocardia humida]|uniref:Peptidyl-prolyl cis-trans isomerase n=1 Tax=Pseudonocardia humida TaxID=2800819 RepID=A0ABT1A478_9PSEU|nr:FKBP-type peptidyl-prolyl cis-trans isomerase [Pseudonocardia humida]MCO1657807.1 FKBP-type peptidyl-prolyl cis-trans isomerase [Pseudonocardia humida]
MKRSLLAAALVAAAAVAGCSSGTETAAPPPAPPSATAVAPPVIAPVGEPLPGIPALLGAPTDLDGPLAAGPGTADPPAGLLAQDLVVGTGQPATADSTVDVRYTGTFYADGSQFDSSWARGEEPIQFPLNGVVPGFAQGIEGMQPGGRRVMVIPPALGYGSQDQRSIPGNSTLVFVVDLVSVS